MSPSYSCDHLEPVWYRSGPLFPKPITGQELFFAVSYGKPTLVQFILCVLASQFWMKFCKFWPQWVLETLELKLRLTHSSALWKPNFIHEKASQLDTSFFYCCLNWHKKTKKNISGQARLERLERPDLCNNRRVF